MWRPYSLGRLLVAPGREVRGFNILLEKDNLAQTLKIILDHFLHNNIPVVFVEASHKKNSTTVIVFADFTDNLDKVAGILSSIKALSGVTEAHLIEPIFNGVLIDYYSFPLVFGPGRAIVMPEPVYSSLVKHPVDKFGLGFTAVNYMFGYETGLRSFKAHLKLAEGDILKTLDFTAKVFTLAGYGKFEPIIFDVEEELAEVKVYNNFECELQRNAGRASGHFTRGLIAGWLAAAVGKKSIKVECEETMCIAKGDPYCYFIARTLEKAQ